jgi:hypothetical protein
VRVQWKTGAAERISSNIPESGLELDRVMPSQFLHMRQRPCEPEILLLVCVLKQAIHDLDMYGRRKDARSQHLAQDVRDWMDGTYHAVVEFKWLCESIGMNPGKVRRVLNSFPREPLFRMRLSQCNGMGRNRSSYHSRQSMNHI